MRKMLSTILLIVSALPLLGQADTVRATKEKEYPFILVDSPAELFTMRQLNESSLSLYRMFMGELNKTIAPKWSELVGITLSGLLYVPLTHEEGHRSVLTHQNIGSISQPYFNEHGAAYVKGVKDADLQSLRNSDLPTYIRLHTAGLESDYAMLLREASLMNWQKENKNVLWGDYMLRKFSLVAYYCYGLFKADAGIEEESDELKRDIVGHDIYGAIRHLHRPDMEFKRYTNYDDLTAEEKKFAQRVGWRSLLNLIDPLLIRKSGFKLNDKLRGNFALGYGMLPFGDYIDEHFWVQTRSLNSHIYFRQYENKNTWFPALGADFYSMNIAKNIYVDAALHGWMQPKDLAFQETSGKCGGAIEVTGKYRFFSRTKGIKGLSLNLGMTAKTQGFLLEEMSMDSHIGLRLGTSIWL